MVLCDNCEYSVMEQIGSAELNRKAKIWILTWKCPKCGKTKITEESSVGWAPFEGYW